MPGWNLKLEEFIFALIKLIKLLGFSLMVILDDGFIHVAYMWQWENATSSFLIKNVRSEILKTMRICILEE
jgi:hypothetical protein